jgi:hypothetical protein
MSLRRNGARHRGRQGRLDEDTTGGGEVQLSLLWRSCGRAAALLLSSATLSAQSPPLALPARERSPHVLLIVQERVKPNSVRAYDRNEREIARTSVRLKHPNPYLALEPLSGPKEVWWLNAFESEADRGRVMQAFDRNSGLMAELRRLGRRKEAFREKPVTILTTYRADLSQDRPWSVSGARFVVVAVTNEARKFDGSVFESADGRRFVMTPAATHREADQKAAQTGAGARIFAIRPPWSYPADAWVAADPEFWRASPAARSRSSAGRDTNRKREH